MIWLLVSNACATSTRCEILSGFHDANFFYLEARRTSRLLKESGSHVRPSG